MSKIIYIADPEILAVPIEECNEPLVDIKNSDQLQYGTPPECELTTNDYTKMRKTVFEKIIAAQKDLPNGYYFRIYEGYRSLLVQKMLFEQEYQRVTKHSPNKSHTEKFHETTRLVSPVINLDGSKNIPPHNTGAAVDIEIMTPAGKLLDMGMEAKDGLSVDPTLCLTGCQTISKTAQKNRQLLHEIMHAHGFINYPTEWWHFSYGDRYWAYHVGAKTAIYGSL